MTSPEVATTMVADLSALGPFAELRWRCFHEMMPPQNPPCGTAFLSTAPIGLGCCSVTILAGTKQRMTKARFVGDIPTRFHRRIPHAA